MLLFIQEVAAACKECLDACVEDTQYEGLLVHLFFFVMLHIYCCHCGPDTTIISQCVKEGFMPSPAISCFPVVHPSVCDKVGELKFHLDKSLSQNFCLSLDLRPNLTWRHRFGLRRKSKTKFSRLSQKSKTKVWSKTRLKPNSTVVCWEFPMQNAYLLVLSPRA